MGSAPKFTPGALWFSPNAEGGFDVGTGDTRLAEVKHNPISRGYKPEFPVDNQANARLFAAAPDLLAACKEWESIWQPGKLHEDAWRRLVAAIAKAEGRS